MKSGAGVCSSGGGAARRAVSCGGTNLKLMNWKGTQRYQLVTTTLLQSCFSLGSTAEGPASAAVSLRAPTRQARTQPHSAVRAATHSDRMAARKGGANRNWSMSSFFTATPAPEPPTRRPRVLYLRPESATPRRSAQSAGVGAHQTCSAGPMSTPPSAVKIAARRASKGPSSKKSCRRNRRRVRQDAVQRRLALPPRTESLHRAAPGR